MGKKDSQSLVLPHRCSLVAETLESLRQGIRQGVWKDVLPGERSLAEELQVSRTTLRSALKELERSGELQVEARHRRRITTRHQGEGKRKGGQVVGVISPSTLLEWNSMNMFVLGTLRNALSRAGFAMEMHTSSAYYSARPARALEKLIADHPATVWILLSSREATEKWFVRRGIPCLVLGSSRPDVHLPSLDADHRATCRHAGGVLLRRGHRRIALILPEGNHGGDADSEAGLRESLKSTEGARLEVLIHNGSAAHICRIVDKSLAGREVPTAFVVARSAHTLTVLIHLLRCGKRLPEDVALISRDDDLLLQSILPSVSRYSLGSEKFARRASRAARQLAESGILPAQAIRLMPDYLKGETV